MASQKKIEKLRVCLGKKISKSRVTAQTLPHCRASLPRVGVTVVRDALTVRKRTRVPRRAKAPGQLLITPARNGINNVHDPMKQQSAALGIHADKAIVTPLHGPIFVTCRERHRGETDPVMIGARKVVGRLARLDRPWPLTPPSQFPLR